MVALQSWAIAENLRFGDYRCIFISLSKGVVIFVLGDTSFLILVLTKVAGYYRLVLHMPDKGYKGKEMGLQLVHLAFHISPG